MTIKISDINTVCVKARLVSAEMREKGIFNLRLNGHITDLDPYKGIEVTMTYVTPDMRVPVKLERVFLYWTNIETITTSPSIYKKREHYLD